MAFRQPELGELNSTVATGAAVGVLCMSPPFYPWLSPDRNPLLLMHSLPFFKAYLGTFGYTSVFRDIWGCCCQQLWEVKWILIVSSLDDNYQEWGVLVVLLLKCRWWGKFKSPLLSGWMAFCTMANMKSVEFLYLLLNPHVMSNRSCDFSSF